MIVFAMTGATGSVGGIASCNLNVLRTLNSLSTQSGRMLMVLSLHEDSHDRPDFLDEQVEFIGFCGRKWAYARRLVSLVRRDHLLVFDHVRLALPLIPFALFGFDEFVIMAHGSESWKRVRVTSKWLFRKARLCLTNSQFTLDKMHDSFSGFRGRVCALGLSPSHDMVMTDGVETYKGPVLQTVDGRDAVLDEQSILLVGRMDRCEREKGHLELLTIWPTVVREFPNAQLVLAGPGSDRAHYMQIAKQLQIGSTVIIPGYLTTEALRALYSRCYAFVMPSRQEGFGLAYLEAMSFAKPCVGCRNGGSAEVIDDGISGLLIDNPYENWQLLRALQTLLGDRTLARNLGQAGLQRLRERFTAAHAQERLRQHLAPMVQCS